MARNDTTFTGALPRLYDRHLGPVIFAPWAFDMAVRFGSLTAGQVLETAAGTGIVTQALAASLPGAVDIVATDLNQPMLDHAAAKPGMERVAFRFADALALPFPDRSFDAVVCQFGVMFFPDRIAGMREARRVLKPGGRFLFNVWGSLADNPLMEATVAGLAKRYPAHPSWFLDRVPCGYHDPDRIRADLTAAGFTSASVETISLPARVSDAQGLTIGHCQGTPMRAEIEAQDPGGLAAATDAAAASVVERFGPAPFEVPMVALVVDAIA